MKPILSIMVSKSVWMLHHEKAAGTKRWPSQLKGGLLNK
ncbi:hypothetical protein FHS18_006815 [Paenibacillus phyllosphaerae]|uniref:Uncharacterized protein n=1 Tax=Paenibacillus phyllosphaerae TaxID=274593 RepID=A0A7W5FRS4_9BACL|nr:hypothetical protein [Paenibacillus phyllosphaerae]